MPELIRRRSPERSDCWHVYYGDVRVGTIAVRAGVPVDVDQWGWQCGFYPPSTMAGTAKTRQRRSNRREAILKARGRIPKCTEAGFEETDAKRPGRRGKTPGGTLLTINGERKRVSGSLVLDNSQSKALGETALNGQIAFNNILGLGEQVYFSAGAGEEPVSHVIVTLPQIEAKTVERLTEAGYRSRAFRIWRREATGQRDHLGRRKMVERGRHVPVRIISPA